MFSVTPLLQLIKFQVTDHATQARGHAKTISKPYVVSAFSLDTPTSKRAIRDKVEQLLDEAHYIYKARSLPSPFQDIILTLDLT